VGEVNINQQAYEHLKSYPDFHFKYRGYIAAKGKGEVEMWFVQHAYQNSDSETPA
jgi:hypothetical protein